MRHTCVSVDFFCGEKPFELQKSDVAPREIKKKQERKKERMNWWPDIALPRITRRLQILNEMWFHFDVIAFLGCYAA